jgi:recombination protein RecT
MQSLTSAYPKFELINPEKAKSELGFAMQIFQQSEYLQRCDPTSILNAVVNVARTSITLNPVMRLAYLIPRKNRCVLEFSYMGLVAMLRDNGCIKSISAHIVYSDEEFEYNIAENKIMHKPNYAETEQEHNSRKIIGCYSRATLPNNEVVYEFMPMWEIEKVKRMSDGSDSKFSAWQTWKDEMIKKSVIKRHFKMLISGNPTEALSTALAIENENNQITSFTSPTTSKKSNLMNTFSDLNEVTDNPNQLTIESSLDEPKIDISQMTDEQIDLQMSSLEIEREPFDLFDSDSQE